MLTPAARSRLLDNLAEVREQVAAAARASGRDASAVTLVGVTKYVGPELIRELVLAGLTELGESRPQALWEKAEALRDLPQVHWHLIGHLQRNKVRRTFPHVSLLHSGDSLRLLEAWRDAALEHRPTTTTNATCGAQPSTRFPVLLEVNISGDAAKHGFLPPELPPLLPQLAALAPVQVVGLMAMAGLEGSAERARHDFDALRSLRDELQASAPPDVKLEQLSMGMSGDFPAAIAAGATLVRVGSALFEGVDCAS